MKLVSNTPSKPELAQGRHHLARHQRAGRDSRSTRPARRGWPGRSARPRVFVGSSSAAQTSSIWSFSLMAPTGHTAAHWPHCTQATSARSDAKAGPMTVLNPRPCGKSAATPWIWPHTVTQRRHLMHLAVSRTSAGVLASMHALRLFAPGVGDLADAQVAGHGLQLAVVVAVAGLAVAVVLARGAVRPRCGAPRARAWCWCAPSCPRSRASRRRPPASWRPPPPRGRPGRRRWPARSPGSRGSGSARPPAGPRPGRSVPSGTSHRPVVNRQCWHHVRSFLAARRSASRGSRSAGSACASAQGHAPVQVSSTSSKFPCASLTGQQRHRRPRGHSHRVGVRIEGRVHQLDSSRQKACSSPGQAAGRCPPPPSRPPRWPRSPRTGPSTASPPAKTHGTEVWPGDGVRPR